MNGPPQFHWRSGLVSGLLWCVMVTVAENLTLAVGNLNWWDEASILILAGLGNLGAGMVWALGADFMRFNRGLLLKFAILLPVAVVVSIAMLKITAEGLNPYLSSTLRLVRVAPLMDLTCRALWANVVYGGLYFLGHHITDRTKQLRRTLSDLRLARGEADMRLREARLQAYRGQVQPATLLEALKALQDRYATDRRAGDQLFDRLIAFLRAAMPGLGGGLSTLAAELNIIETYAMLCNILRSSGPRWRLEISARHAGPISVPFRLLTSLDTIDRCMPPEQIIEIRTTFRSGTVGIEVSANTAHLDDDEERRLRTDLELALGGNAIFLTEPMGNLSLDLRLPADAVDGKQPNT